MPLKYKVIDEDAPLYGLDIPQTDLMRFHMGTDRNIGVKVLIYLYFFIYF